MAFAVFDENFDELEAIAAYPSREAFGRLWLRLLDLTVEASAFVEVVVDARRVPWAGALRRDTAGRPAADDNESDMGG